MDEYVDRMDGNILVRKVRGWIPNGRRDLGGEDAVKQEYSKGSRS